MKNMESRLQYCILMQYDSIIHVRYHAYDIVIVNYLLPYISQVNN
jgi:hypothetical protein